METKQKDILYKLIQDDLTANTEELKKLLKPYKNGSVGIAQLNTICADLKYNSEKIINYIEIAQNIELDLVVFPKFALCGYPLKDTPNRYPNFVKENLKILEKIAKSTKNTTAVISFIVPDDKCYRDAIAIVSNGEIKKIIQKQQECTFTINGLKYAIALEDTNYENLKCDIIIDCTSNSIFEKGKDYASIAKRNAACVITVNQAGVSEQIPFKGASKVYDTHGKLMARAKSFEEQFLIVNPIENIGKIYPEYEYISKIGEEFSIDYEADLERTYKVLIQGIKDYFNKSGFKRAVLGLSGGLDSTVCAVLLTDALGKENVLGISMPSKITTQESKTDARQLAANLGIGFSTVPIKDMFDITSNCLENLFKEIETKWDSRYCGSYTNDNIQARSRAVILWGISNEFANSIAIATSDKSEIYMGYATINGDMSGGYAPIADITKTKLFALARWLNKNREEKNTIPESIIQKRPGAELAIDPNTGKPLCAEDALMPYEFMDEVIWRIENKKESYNDMINSTFLYEKYHDLSIEQKAQWLDKFYRRMASAVFKQTLLPPTTFVDTELFDKKFPLCSSGINYK